MDSPTYFDTNEKEIIIKFNPTILNRIMELANDKDAKVELIGITRKVGYARLKVLTTYDEAETFLKSKLDEKIQIMHAVIEENTVKLSPKTLRIVNLFSKILKPLFEQKSIRINERDSIELALLFGIEKMLRDSFPSTDTGLQDIIISMFVQDADIAEKIVRLRPEFRSEVQKAYDNWIKTVLWRLFREY